MTRLTLILPVLLLTLLVWNPAYSADFQKGVDAYNSGDCPSSNQDEPDPPLRNRLNVSQRR